MGLELKELRTSDYPKVIDFAIKGMHFDWYITNEMMLNLYGRYFLYLEMLKATHILAAYDGDELAGVLMCERKGRKPKHSSFWKSCYVGCVDLVQRTVFKEGVGSYEAVNKKMLADYKRTHRPDGEIVFLAANPDSKVKGVGSFLLNELAKREAGKTIYLYTDTGCSYQFYDRRGFERVGDEPVTIQVGRQKKAIRCLLYSKTL